MFLIVEIAIVRIERPALLPWLGMIEVLSLADSGMRLTIVKTEDYVIDVTTQQLFLRNVRILH
jgi:hypothetical protein